MNRGGEAGEEGSGSEERVEETGRDERQAASGEGETLEDALVESRNLLLFPSSSSLLREQDSLTSEERRRDGESDRERSARGAQLEPSPGERRAYGARVGPAGDWHPENPTSPQSRPASAQTQAQHPHPAEALRRGHPRVRAGGGRRGGGRAWSDWLRLDLLTLFTCSGPDAGRETPLLLSPTIPRLLFTITVN